MDPSSLAAALEGAGVAAGGARALAEAVLAPPAGVLDAGDLERARPLRQLLLCATVAPTHLAAHGRALTALVAWLAAREAELTPEERGRLAHLRAVELWRVQGDANAAGAPLERSIALLSALPSPEARAYLPRPLDTSGQRLQHLGLLDDARADLERALALRRELGDEAGAAVTLGGLGRLCLEAGDFAAARGYLVADLGQVERLFPEATRLRAQLLSHLGDAALGLGEPGEARALFARSLALAGPDGNSNALAFGHAGLARAALAERDLAAAEREAGAARRALAGQDVGAGIAALAMAVLLRTRGNLALAQGDSTGAGAALGEALAKLSSLGEVAPLEAAGILREQAQAALAGSDAPSAAHLLRAALRHLDTTHATALRREVERELRALSADAWLLHAAGRFLGQHRIELALSEAGRAGFQGEKLDLVLLFSDVRGFTSLSEKLAPSELVGFLNDYLSRMARCVTACGGTVDKFIGDAVMAVWSLPAPRPDDADAAVRAALLMQAELARFNRARGVAPLESGIGIHAGPVVAGLIGSPESRSFTELGDAVNTASRLEGATKALGASVLVSGEVVRRLASPARYLLRPLGRFRVKGRAAAIELFDVMGYDEPGVEAGALRAEAVRCAAAVADFQARRFAAARDAFEALAAASSNRRGRGYRLLRDASGELDRRPPAESWGGEVALTEK